MRKKRSTPATAEPKTQLTRIRNHPFIVPVITFMVLFFVAVVGFIAFSGGGTAGATDSHVVTLTLDDKPQTIPTRARTVGDLLHRLNITLGTQDTVDPAADTAIEEDNMDIHIYKARPVQVVDGDKKIIAFTAEPDPARLAKQQGIDVQPEDEVRAMPVDSVETSDVVKDGVIAEQIVVKRATPINLNLYGTAVPIRTQAATVGDMMVEKDIQLNEGDTIQPSPETPITANLEVFVIRSGKQVTQVEEAIDPPIEYVDDFNVTLGSTITKDPGQPGKKLVTYEVEQQNGVETSRNIIQEIVVTPPVKKIVARGRKAPVVAGNKAEIMAAAGISANEYYAADFIIGHESGWRVNAQNSRGCGGLGQACPYTKLANSCPNWQSDPVCQMRYFTNYARSKYGSWSRAYEVWQLQRWW